MPLVEGVQDCGQALRSARGHAVDREVFLEVVRIHERELRTLVVRQFDIGPAQRGDETFLDGAALPTAFAQGIEVLLLGFARVCAFAEVEQGVVEGVEHRDHRLAQPRAQAVEQIADRACDCWCGHRARALVAHVQVRQIVAVIGGDRREGMPSGYARYAGKSVTWTEEIDSSASRTGMPSSIR